VAGTGVVVGQGGTFRSLINGGTISGGNATVAGGGRGIYLFGLAITTLSNSGTISGGNGGISGGFAAGTGLWNRSTITTLSNSGTIRGGNRFRGALANGGTITALTNTGGIVGGVGSAGSAGGAGVSNTKTRMALFASTITTLTNSGTISGGAGRTGGAGGAGASNSGVITTLSNQGAIQGGAGGNTATSGGQGGRGVYNETRGTIASLINQATGAISGGDGGSGGTTGGAGGAGVSNTKPAVGVPGTIKSLTNTGTISGGVGGSGGKTGGAGGAGISNTGTISRLTNSGVIKGGKGGTGAAGNGAAGDAILSTRLLGPIANSGQIIGNVEVDNQASVGIHGGSGKTFGSFSGGAITIGNGDLVFASGNTDLADNIAVNGGAGKVTNQGVLRLAAPQTITGNFVQTGTFDSLIAGGAFGQYGALTITSLATLDGRLALDLTNGFTLAAGDSFDLFNSAGLSFTSPTGDFRRLTLDGANCLDKGGGVWSCPSLGPLVLAETISAGSLDLNVVASPLELNVVASPLVTNAAGTNAAGTNAPVPEPPSWVMLTTGLLGLARMLRRRRSGLVSGLVILAQPGIQEPV
jgi:hypothetical protein